MLIVEGPDGAGKTTLVNELAARLQWPIMPRVVSKDTEAMVDLVKWVQDDMELGFSPRIYDRHRLISEPIYGPVIRATLEPGFDNLGWLAGMQYQLREIQPVVIWCLPSLSRVMTNLAHDEDNRVVRDKIRQIYWLYHNACASWPIQCYVWDYEGSTEAEIQALVDALRKDFADVQSV